MPRTLRRFLPAAILGVVWGLFVAYSWPGFMTWDSVNQLIQARSGNYGNWHPPIMARLWSLLDAIIAGPALMLILQTSLFLVGLYHVLRRYAAPVRAAVASALVFLFPPVFAPLSVIWKDSLMAAVLLCAVAGLTAPARLPRLAGWLALVAVAALRHNAPILIVPLTAMLVPPAAHGPAWRRRALGAALGIAVSLAGLLVSRALTRVDEHPFANMIAMPDLAAVIATSGPMTDAEVGTLTEGVPLVGPPGIQVRLRALGADDGDYEAISLGDQRVFDLVTTDAQASGMVRAWRRALTAHPGTYLAHRAQLLREVLGFTRTRSLPYVTPLSENRVVLGYAGEVRSYSEVQRAVARLLRRISRNIMFWPMLYFVLGIGLVVILWRDPLQRGLLMGALGYELTLFFLSPGGQEYRYSHWMITCVVIATVVRILGVLRAPGATPAGATPVG
ncbi:MAG TPA: hypothetical protein VHN14_05355 [Kofleriaceae bacterium]|nr:hypothetical protein [Kofleriaceae bacterium]